ncbi:Hypothetical predicted protein [Prunus dulcis]|uniref:Uncharacterized protein n=1 Tax=Prunus dulcis TaxID=3755 RepID=A0A5E4GHX4_PRUDU|nr:Hypothetical predicted protein [Prunus dulcis]
MPSAPTIPEMVQSGEIVTLNHLTITPASDGDQRNSQELKNGANLAPVCILEALLPTCFMRLDGAQ